MKLNCGRIALVLPLAMVLVACTQPLVNLKPPASQDSAVTIRDWDRVAERIAEGMERSSLLPGATIRQQSTNAAGPYYLHVVASGSAFLNSVKAGLTHQIMQRGGAVATTPLDATVVNLDVDWVHWSPRRPGGTGTVTGLAFGGALTTLDVGINSGSGRLGSITPLELAAIAVGTGIAADVLRAVTPTQGAEAAWRAYIVSPTQVLFQSRAPMYVEVNDLPLYQSTNRSQPLSSPGPSLALATAPVRFAR